MFQNWPGNEQQKASEENLKIYIYNQKIHDSLAVWIKNMGELEYFLSVGGTFWRQKL